MIAYLRGIIRHLDDTSVVLDAGGVGYEILLPTIEAKALRSRVLRESAAPAAAESDGSSAGSAPASAVVEAETAMWIYYHVAERQPRPLLIGFHQRDDREFFQLLLSVSDIGPAVAARSMTIPVCDYADAIERRDVRTLGTLPGIGKRKAEQIVATLKGKALRFALLPAPEISEPETPVADFAADAAAVLENMGHRPAEAHRMIQAAQERRPDISDVQGLLEEVWRERQTQ